MAAPPALFAAGSLKPPLSRLFARTVDRPRLIFGPSGLLRARIEAGEPCALFASADEGHAQRLHEAGLADPPRRFAGNALVALSRGDLGLTPETLVPRLMTDDLVLGHSTPGADPSGDYALQAFAGAEAIVPGAAAALTARGRALTGGTDAPSPPPGRSLYGWLVAEGAADVFITYRSNALEAQREDGRLAVIPLPAPMRVATGCWLCVLDAEGGAPLADRLLSAEAARILQACGFSAP